MSLKDTFTVTDNNSLRGFVVIKDNKTGRILVENHNMILKEGKDCILSHFLFKDKTQTYISELADTSDLQSLRNYFLSHCVFYKNDSEVAYTENFDAPGSRNSFSTNEVNRKNQVLIPLSKDNFKIEIEDNHFILKITLNIDLLSYFDASTDNKEFTSLALLLSDGNTGTNYETYNNYKTFSRIRFDSIFLTQDSSLNLTYYVYF